MRSARLASLLGSSITGHLAVAVGIAVPAAIGLGAFPGCGDNGSGGSGGTGGSGGNGGSATSSSSSSAGGATSSTGGAGGSVPGSGTTVSSSIVVSADDSRVYVVNQDSDSVSIIDTSARSLVKEIPLGKTPAFDATNLRYDPACTPRSLALVDENRLYVTCQASAQVLVVDLSSQSVVAQIPVAVDPVSVVSRADGSALYVVSHQGATVTVIDPKTNQVTGKVAVTEHPWGASLSADGKTLFVTHLLLDPGISLVDTASLSVTSKTKFADQPVGTDKRIPNGPARGLYSVVPRPTTGELWVPHLLLGINTAQPDLNFESTVFPTISTFQSDGTTDLGRLLFKPTAVSTATGAFIDSVSGPRALAFTPDGKLALLTLAQSEDLMVFDADKRVEAALLRPIPSALLEGIAIDHAGTHAYIDGRNTHDLTVLSIDETDQLKPVKVDGAVIDRLVKDPMPANLRHGQRLFNTANSKVFPITTNFWVSCASCHIEGGSDAVTWLFNQGPRDTPSNVGGPGHAGFLMRQALRSDVVQYDETIRNEQGGLYDRTEQTELPDLQALADYVNQAIPYPPNPNLAPNGQLTTSQAKGKTTFESRCSSCHTGDYLSDSAAGNASLDLSGTIQLHNIGTCVTSGLHPDEAMLDALGNQRTACDFDTPSLRSIFASAPYFHDGSAKTLDDVVKRLPFSSNLDDADRADLVEYLKTL